MATQKKINTVTSLTEKINKAKIMVFADYRGIKHKQLEDIRRRVKKVDGEFLIAKNRLVKRSLGDRAEGVSSTLENTTAVLFAYNDEVAPLKELLKFFKDVALGQTKGALMGTNALSAREVTTLATLPPREVLLGRLAGQLQAPLSGLHNALSWNIRTLVYALSAIKEKKT